jgi:phytoene synthase
MSDATCTALQLANFWQDVARDLEKGRLYIPLDIAAAHGLTEADIVGHRFDERFVGLMKDLIARTRLLFEQGAPLAKMVSGRLSVDLEMFSRGGLAVLDAIESMGYDTLHRRPAISKAKQVRLLGRVLLTSLLAKRIRPESSAGDLALVVAQQAAPETSKPVSDSYAACHSIARAAHSNFYYAFFLLPKPKRDALAALYAFMRLVDDVADEGQDLAAKQRGLAKWRAAFDEAVTGESQVFDGTAAKPLPAEPLPGEVEVLPALVDTMQRYKMPARYLHDLISGAEMDLTLRSYPTFDRLREYCYRVAGTVGLTCTHVFGFHDPRALDLAEKLGLAFQLTNIIRDVHDDYALGRVYLPEEDLARYGVSPQDFGTSEATLGVRELLRFEADRAWQCYEEGRALFGLIDRESQGALWLLVHTYSALLARMESLDFAVFGERVRLSKVEKMLFIAKARFGRLLEENILEKRDGDRRRTGGTGSQRRAG